jgi:hypothetical protein
MNDTSTRKYEYILLVANIAVRLLFIVFPFWGLEYEDSYVFNDSARFMNSTNNFYNNSFITNCCINGSYNKCDEYGSFGGHFITFPFILSKLNNLIGYHSWNIFALNFTFSITLLVIVFVWAKRSNTNYFSLPLFLLLMLITPFVSLFNTSGLSETFSSLVVTCSIVSFFTTSENDFKINHYTFYLTILSFALALLIKRENLVLLAIFPIISLYRFQHNKKIFPRGYWLLLSFVIIAFVFLYYTIGIFSIENNEEKDIGASTFSLTYFIVNFKQFWGITGIFLIISVCLAVIKKTHSYFNLICLLMAVAYLITYSSHYRSFYQVNYDFNDPFETLRYSVNYFPLLCLFLAAQRFEFIFKYKKVVVLSVLLLLGNVIYSRVQLSNEEWYNRIEPIKKTLSVVKENDIIITDLPIVFHCFISRNQYVMNYYNSSMERLKQTIFDNKNRSIYILRPRNFQIDSMRFKSDIDITKLPFSEVNLELEHYQLFKLSK